MTRSAFTVLLCGLTLAALAIGCDPTPVRMRRDTGVVSDAGGGGPMLPDADGDGIPDSFEGRPTNVDTDGDGTPDYLDADSDGDGVSDMLEGGNPNGMPLDTDTDGTPDFRDLDSDGNGVPDSVEGDADLDRDGSPNSRDTDNDGDTVTDREEIGASPTSPLDTERDLVPDYLDLDSDNDQIGDRDESVVDTDRDGVVDRWDADSDDDGINDIDEAGDADINTAPVDTDRDMIADFRDTDSDGDGLSDMAEHAFDLAHPGAMTVTHADSDGDGVSDLVEVASGSNPLDPADSPRTRGNFVFLEPYMAPPDPLRDTLDFATNIRSADVYFLMDTTGSMGASISSLASGIATPTTGLIDRVRAVIPDVYFGIGEFKDYSDGVLYQNHQDLAMDPAASRAAASALFPSGGGDGPEGDVPALYAVASGADLGGYGVPARSGCPGGTFGWPCFRTGAVPIIVLITDFSFHNDRAGNDAFGYTTYPTMLTAITANRIRVMGIAQQTSGDYGALPDLNDIAMDSGAVDGAGAPLVSVYTGGSISDAVVTQIATLANQTRFDISIRYEDDATDAVDTFPAFVDHIEANTVGDAARGCGPHPATDTNGDGFPDTFPGVTAGEHVCFDIVVKQNDTVMPTAVPQLFLATLHVIGDGFTELDSRDVYFLVPPTIEPPGGPM